MQTPQDPQVDLRWLLTSPSLLSGSGEHGTPIVQFDAEQQAAIATWLSQVDAAPDALVAFVENMRPANEVPLRIGRYAERLLQFFLTHGPTHRLIASNIVVPHSSRVTDHTTAGEIDFLVEDIRGGLYHWELALKYFLATRTQTPRVVDYVGPDGSEALARKLVKMKRQLSLPIPAPWNEQSWQRAGLTRGQLFYNDSPTQLAEELNATHQQGKWCTTEEFAAAFADKRLVVLHRQHWLGPRCWLTALRCDEAAAMLLDNWQLAAAAQKRLVAAMVAVVEPCNEGYRDVARCFVLPPAGIPGLS